MSREILGQKDKLQLSRALEVRARRNDCGKFAPVRISLREENITSG